MARKLQSLDDHNAAAWEAHRSANEYPRPNGIACPKCGKELMDTDATTLMSYPAQKNVKCSVCDYRGLRLA